MEGWNVVTPRCESFGISGTTGLSYLDQRGFELGEPAKRVLRTRLDLVLKLILRCKDEHRR